MASKYGYRIEMTEETCPDCGESNVSAVFKVDLSTDEWTDTGVRLCHNCGHVWIKS